MRRPRTSSMASVPLFFTASVTCFSTSSTVSLVSSTTSRGACCTPILTSMGLSSLLVGVLLVGQGVAADAAPGQARDQGRGVTLLDTGRGAGRLGQPEPGADLGHSHQR